MDIGGINLGEIWTTVGGVLGTPAAIFLFWTYSKVNDLAKNELKQTASNAIAAALSAFILELLKKGVEALRRKK